MRSIRTTAGILLVTACAAPAIGQVPVFHGPTSYACAGDSPFDPSGLGTSFFREDFEDGLLDTPGVAADVGTPGTGFYVDSVDCDDGLIDGDSSTSAHSYFSIDGTTGITFTFDAGVLGSLPTRVGIVWTDGQGPTSFEAFDGNGVSLGLVGPYALDDADITGATAEDSFLGVTYSGGIGSIWINNIGGGIEVDHLQYRIAAPLVGTAFCFGDAASACPCANFGAPGRGCQNSLATGGALLAATGTPSVAHDSITLVGSSMPNSSALYFQGTARQNAGLGSVFGDGLRCAGGSVVRLGTQTNASGASQYPAAGDASVSVRGAAAPGNTRTYQVWYRNAAAYCTASTFNLSNGLELVWQP